VSLHLASVSLPAALSRATHVTLSYSWLLADHPRKQRQTIQRRNGVPALPAWTAAQSSSRSSRAPPPPYARPHDLRCTLHSSQHLGIVGDKALARMKYMGLCRNKLSLLPPKICIMVSLVEVRCTDNWLKNLPEVRRLSVCSFLSAVQSVKALCPWLASLLLSAYGGTAKSAGRV
jgi:hypothetical protein